MYSVIFIVLSNYIKVLQVVNMIIASKKSYINPEDYIIADLWDNPNILWLDRIPFFSRYKYDIIKYIAKIILIRKK